MTNEEKALLWYKKHKEHVDKLVKTAPTAYPPSKEDAGHPELWKDAHWKWLLDQKRFKNWFDGWSEVIKKL